MNPLTAWNMIYEHEFIILLHIIILLVICVYFVSIRRTRRVKLTKLLYRDKLTGKWNYNQFKISAYLLFQKESRPNYSLLYLDISKFSYFNDVYGYTEGDKVLIDLSNILESFATKSEIFSRVTADEFAVLLEYKNISELFARLDFLNPTIKKMSEKYEKGLKLIVCGGVYILNAEDTDIVAVIDKAIQAKEVNQNPSDNSFFFYDDEIWKKELEEHKLMREAKFALDNNEFVAFFQPKVELATRNIVACEALARWNHKERGLLCPSEFIPLIEKNGLIVSLDLYIFEAVCATLKKWINENKKIIPISCNFSRMHFLNPNLPFKLKEIADRYLVPTSLLDIEITETITVKNVKLATLQIQQLQDMGFEVSIDDFGSEYSSFEFLESIPADTLKLDKKFLDYNKFEKTKGSVVKTIISMARSLNMKVVCEGVETEEQAILLENFDCKIAQGFLFYKPMPLNELEAILNKQAK